MAHGQNLTSNLANIEVHNPLLIVEDAQSEQLLGEPLDILGSVRSLDTNQDKQSLADARILGPIDLDRCAANSLN